MGSEYDKSKLTKYLQYLDANNLYGWTMSQLLPTGEFRWVEFREDRNLKTIVEELVVKNDRGYLLKVDVRYPKKLHVNGVEKLVLNLYYKRKYVIHVRALAQALEHGLVLERIHRCIEFKQSAWMKE